ncbi:hypothetical protein Taro_000208 [Colocasia esculenta]|uniref:Uncharacterized protein n=1 Tax=Colocasia esculenta TaxID=4460 RepID=A0A843TE67_COLES|nr:hypothetical protein [Colocasia esculenta]
MPGTFRDSGPSSLKTNWGPVRLLVSDSPNYERATRYNTTNSLSSRCPTAVFPSAGRTTQHKSEGVQVYDKNSTVLSTGTSPEHTRAWLTQNLGLPTEEASNYMPRTRKPRAQRTSHVKPPRKPCEHDANHTHHTLPEC